MAFEIGGHSIGQWLELEKIDRTADIRREILSVLERIRSTEKNIRFDIRGLESVWSREEANFLFTKLLEELPLITTGDSAQQGDSGGTPCRAPLIFNVRELIMFKRIHKPSVAIQDLRTALEEIESRERRIESIANLSDSDQYYFHGSATGDMEMLRPIRKSTDVTEFGNLQLLFATPDIYWSMWFALLNRTVLISTNNTCIYNERYSLYDLAYSLVDGAAYPLNEYGYIYVCQRSDFPMYDINTRLAEHGSKAPVVPMGSFKVCRDDLIIPFHENS